MEAIEEKIDLILDYQRSIRRMAIARAVISVILFFVFVVLPIIGGFYLARYIQENVDLGKITSQYQNFQQGMEDIKEKTDELKGLTEQFKQFGQ